MAVSLSLLVGGSKAIIKDAVKIIKPTTKVKDFIKPDMIICLLYRYSALSVPDSWQNACPHCQRPEKAFINILLSTKIWKVGTASYFVRRAVQSKASEIRLMVTFSKRC